MAGKGKGGSSKAGCSGSARVPREVYAFIVPALILWAVLSFSLPAAGWRQTHSGAGKHEILCDGLKRSYYVHVPPTYSKTKKVPLVFVFHGGGGNAARIGKFTGFDSLSDRKGFIVVYPDGFEHHFNDGRTGTGYATHERNINDVGFVGRLIDVLSQQYDIDRCRIYAAGISNGGIFSQRLGVELSGRIAAIASVVGSLAEEVYESATPSSPVSVLVIAGVDDPLVPWQGGDVHIGKQKKMGRIAAIEDTVKFWVRHDGCRSEPEISYLADSDPADGVKVRRQCYGHGKDDSEVVLLAQEGGGHTWPGGFQYLPPRMIGKTCRDFRAEDVIWDFFAKHPLRQSDK